MAAGRLPWFIAVHKDLPVLPDSHAAGPAKIQNLSCSKLLVTGMAIAVFPLGGQRAQIE
jgi:hypothetical protein